DPIMSAISGGISSPPIWAMAAKSITIDELPVAASSIISNGISTTSGPSPPATPSIRITPSTRAGAASALFCIAACRAARLDEVPEEAVVVVSSTALVVVESPCVVVTSAAVVIGPSSATLVVVSAASPPQAATTSARQHASKNFLDFIDPP